MPDLTIANFCGLLIRSRLVPAEEVRDLRQRWQHEGGDEIGSTQHFVDWLVNTQYLTGYQAGLLLRGKADHFFLNEYKLLDRVGKGRMAGVYKAVHRLGQTVAIKVLPPSKARDPNIFARFQREARLALKLAHPNIVRTYQTGEAGDLHFIVMEFLDGETLEDVLKRRQCLPVAEAVRVVHQALLGLGHMHEQGMVHRDLKAGNLMLMAGPGEETADSTMGATVKILDIGLGRALFDEEDTPYGQPADLTTQGDVIGTPDYLAPEQARDSHAADIRSDIYSLGCVLYHALGGQVPFPGNNPVRKMVQHANEPPRPLGELNPQVPAALRQIVEWMMAKDPNKRYPTPDRAAEALAVFLAAGKVPARGPEGDPKMRPYLEWLKKQAAVGAPAPLAAPVTAPVVAAPKKPGAKPQAETSSYAQIDVERLPSDFKPGAAAAGGWKFGGKELIFLGIGAIGLFAFLIAIAVVVLVLILR